MVEREGLPERIDELNSDMDQAEAKALKSIKRKKSFKRGVIGACLLGAGIFGSVLFNDYSHLSRMHERGKFNDNYNWYFSSESDVAREYCKNPPGGSALFEKWKKKCDAFADLEEELLEYRETLLEKRSEGINQRIIGIVQVMKSFCSGIDVYGKHGKFCVGNDCEVRYKTSVSIHHIDPHPIDFDLLFDMSRLSSDYFKMVVDVEYADTPFSSNREVFLVEYDYDKITEAINGDFVNSAPDFFKIIVEYDLNDESKVVQENFNRDEKFIAELIAKSEFYTSGTITNYLKEVYAANEMVKNTTK